MRLLYALLERLSLRLQVMMGGAGYCSLQFWLMIKKMPSERGLKGVNQGRYSKIKLDGLISVKQ